MNECRQVNCPFRSNSSSSVYGCEHIACPNRDDGSITWIATDHTIAPTLTPPNEWVSVEERLPEPGERVLATDCGFVGEFYINKRGKWQRYNVNCSELLMALDILYWMPLPAPHATGGDR